MAQEKELTVYYPIRLSQLQYEWLRNRAFGHRTSMAALLRAALQRAMDTEKNDA